MRRVLGGLAVRPDNNNMIVWPAFFAEVALWSLFVIENSYAEAVLPDVACIALDEEVGVNRLLMNVVELELIVAADTSGYLCGLFLVLRNVNLGDVIRAAGSPRLGLLNVFHGEAVKDREK